MLKTSVVAGLAVLLAVPATPAGAASTQVSGVQLAWADSTYQKIRITWTESAPVANTVVFERPGLNDVPLGTLPSDAPNTLLVAREALQPTGNHGAIGRIVVSEPNGDEARSADFDRYIRTPTDPALSFTADGGIRWSLPPEPADPTPKDPLDVDQPTRYLPTVRVADRPPESPECVVVDLPESTTPAGAIAIRNRAYHLSITTFNEWTQYGHRGGEASVATTAIGLTAPTASVYGNQLTLSGTTSSRHIHFSDLPPVCLEVERSHGGGTTVILHARNSSTSPWYVVGTTKTTEGGKYSFTLRNPGAREYRTVIARSAANSTATYGSSSAVRLVKASTRVVSAKFIDPTVAYGTKPQAYLWVDPAGSQRAALQFKNASGAWQGVGYKTLYAGRGILTFPWSRRGTTYFRWWVAASSSSQGLSVDAGYTYPFTLSVR